jgi:hypothetical protein
MTVHDRTRLIGQLHLILQIDFAMRFFTLAAGVICCGFDWDHGRAAMRSLGLLLIVFCQIPRDD